MTVVFRYDPPDPHRSAVLHVRMLSRSSPMIRSSKSLGSGSNQFSVFRTFQSTCPLATTDHVG